MLWYYSNIKKTSWRDQNDVSPASFVDELCVMTGKVENDRSFIYDPGIRPHRHVRELRVGFGASGGGNTFLGSSLGGRFLRGEGTEIECGEPESPSGRVGKRCRRGAADSLASRGSRVRTSTSRPAGYPHRLRRSADQCWTGCRR